MAAAYVVTARLGERALVATLLEARELAAASGGTYAFAPLNRDEARASLVRAIELGPAPWVARELALTLARLEFAAGVREARRVLVNRPNPAAPFYVFDANAAWDREARA